MAKEEKTTSKQSKRQTQIGSRGGGNIGGLLLLGGALAVGSLVATFAARKGNRQKGSGENCKRKEDQSSRGLHFVLQSSSSEFHGNPCCAGDGSTKTVEAAQIEPTQLVSTDNLVLEKNPSSEVDSSHKNSDKIDQEILLPENPKQGTIEMCDSSCWAKEIQLPEVNIPSLDKLDKYFGNVVAKVDSVEVTEEDAVDGVQTSREEIISVESTKEEDDDDIEEKSRAKESSATPVEEDNSNNSTEESPLEEIIEVEQEEEESIEKVEGEDVIDSAKKTIEESSSVKSIDEEDDDDDDEKEDNEQQVKEKFLEEKIKFEEEGEPIGVSIVDEDRVVIDNFKKELPLKDITEVEHEAKDEPAEDDAVDAVKMCIEENSLPISTQNDNTGRKLPIDEKDRGNINLSDDDESLSKKSEDNLGGTGRSSTKPSADEFKTAVSVEANAQLSAAKTEQDEKNQSKEFNCFDSSKGDFINGFTDINQTRKDLTFAQKDENLEFAVCNTQPTIITMKSRISVEMMLMVAPIVLLFLPIAMGYLSHLV